MKKVLIVFLTLALPSTTLAAAGISLLDTNDGDSTVYVDPGDSFTITAHVTNDTDEELYGLGFWLEDIQNSGYFTIYSITHLTNWDPTTAPGTIAGPPLDPINTNDLGAVGSQSDAIIGDFDFAEITLSVDPGAAEGSYDIKPGDSPSGVGYEGTVIGPPPMGLPEPLTFDVADPVTVIVPEPASILLSLAAIPLLRRRKA